VEEGAADGKIKNSIQTLFGNKKEKPWVMMLFGIHTPKIMERGQELAVFAHIKLG